MWPEASWLPSLVPVPQQSNGGRPSCHGEQGAPPWANQRRQREPGALERGPQRVRLPGLPLKAVSTPALGVNKLQLGGQVPAGARDHLAKEPAERHGAWHNPVAYPALLPTASVPGSVRGMGSTDRQRQTGVHGAPRGIPVTRFRDKGVRSPAPSPRSQPSSAARWPAALALEKPEAVGGASARGRCGLGAGPGAGPAVPARQRLRRKEGTAPSSPWAGHRQASRRAGVSRPAGGTPLRRSGGPGPPPGRAGLGQTGVGQDFFLPPAAVTIWPGGHDLRSLCAWRGPGHPPCPPSPGEGWASSFLHQPASPHSL